MWFLGLILTGIATSWSFLSGVLLKMTVTFLLPPTGLCYSPLCCCSDMHGKLCLSAASCILYSSFVLWLFQIRAASTTLLLILVNSKPPPRQQNKQTKKKSPTKQKNQPNKIKNPKTPQKPNQTKEKVVSLHTKLPFHYVPSIQMCIIPKQHCLKGQAIAETVG